MSREIIETYMSNRTGTFRGSARIGVLPLLAGAHILALYLWQIALLRPRAVHRAASWLGLYVLSSGDAPSELLPELTQLTALVGLAAALGYYLGGADGGAAAADDPSTRVRARLSQMTAPSAIRDRPQVAFPGRPSNEAFKLLPLACNTVAGFGGSMHNLSFTWLLSLQGACINLSLLYGI